MPELPDVETYRRYLDANALHQCVARVHVEAPALLANATPQSLGRALAHRCFDSTQRHGKHLFLRLDNGACLMMHFGMSGRLKYLADAAKPPEHTRVLIHFTNGSQLAYIAPRKLGRLEMTEGPQAFVEHHHLGPDALTLDLDELLGRANGRRGGVKSWLTDQKAIAGIGNIYGDEILFHAQLHPQHPVSCLGKPHLQTLHRKLHYVLEKASDARADPARMPRSWLIRHRVEGGRCPRCGTRLEQARIAGRRSWYCPSCQRQQE